MADDVDPKVIQLLVPGPQGAPGAIMRGAYDPAVQYEARDGVSFNGSSWFTLTPVIGVAPPLSPWLVLAGKGDQGPQGVAGPKGDKGDKGDEGPQGADGVQGIAGPQGGKGDKGDQGDAGPKGDKGDAGDQGAQGPKGDTGDAGPDGAQGAVGPQGLKGDKGDKGDTGTDGVQGVAGPQGLKGDKGDKGDTGADGPQGVAGPVGGEGPQGPQGNDGPQGAQGDAGPQGVAGPIGPVGPEGPQGLQGNDGAAGPQGPIGGQGPQGPKGDSGATLVVKGPYDNAQVYSAGQIVSYSGSAYYLNGTYVGTITGVVPPTAPWLLWNDNTTTAVNAQAAAVAAATLARNYAMGTGNTDVVGGTPGDRSAQYWAAVASYLGTFFNKVTPDFLFGAQMRIRIGNRIYATLDAAKGFYFRKLMMTSAAKIDDQPTLNLGDRILMGPLGSWFRQGPREVQSGGIRFRLANRLFGTLDAANGFYFRKLMMPASAKIDDQPTTTIVSRIFGSAIGSWFKQTPREVMGAGLRFRVGNRLYLTIDLTNGLYPRKMTIPQGALVDDDLTSPLTTRLLSGGMGNMFRKLPREIGSTLRLRWGNRLLGQWSSAGGMQFTRQTLPADCKVADQPLINLVDRLGSSSANPYCENTNYIVTSFPDATTGKRQVRSFRKSDGHQFSGLTSGAQENLAQWITTGNQVVYWSIALGRHMYIPAEGGATYRVFPDGTTWDFWGNSLIASAGTTGGHSITELFAFLMGALVAVVNNRGVGGQTIEHIGGRINSAPAQISVNSNLIPASGAVTVTAYSQDILYNSGTSGSLSLTGTLAGVPGTLSGNATTGVNTATYAFTRTTAGSAVACPPNTPFITDFGVQTIERSALLEAGRNDGWSNPPDLTAKMVAMHGVFKALYPRVLVSAVLVGVTEIGTSNQTSIAAVNSAYAAALGDDFFDDNVAPTLAEIAAMNAAFGVHLGATFTPDAAGPYMSNRTDAADMAGQACGAYTFTGNLTSGDTVTIGSTVLTAGADFSIGATSVLTAANLASYINAHSALGVTAVSGTAVDGTVRLVLAAIISGTAGNSIAIAKSSANLTVTASTLTGGSAFGVIPSGMRNGALVNNGDFLHGNFFMYALRALRVYRKVYTKGWYPTLANI